MALARGAAGVKEDGGCVVLELPVRGRAAAFDLESAVCSHGLFMMAPNRWDPASKTFHRPLRLSSSPSPSLPVRISHPSPSRPLLVSVSGTTSLSFADQQAILDQVCRMLRISEEDDLVVREFQDLHEGARERGFGRIFRSPNLFEDMVKCILLCNCQWPRSLSMARALCELQLELKSSKSSEDFQPKTPLPAERKRKRGNKRNVVKKLETVFSENMVEDLQTKKEGIDGNDSYKLSNVNRNDASIKLDQIGDFPSPEELATLSPTFLAQRCSVGYRAQRIISLAQSIVDGKLELKNFEMECEGFTRSAYEKLDSRLSLINGFGPYTRANVLMCMGFFNRIPADTETIRHLKQFHGRRCSIGSVQKDIDAIYGKYASFQYLAFWFEVWDDYEKRFGKISQMSPSDYNVFTACNMKSRVSQ